MRRIETAVSLDIQTVAFAFSVRDGNRTPLRHRVSIANKRRRPKRPKGAKSGQQSCEDACASTARRARSDRTRASFARWFRRSYSSLAEVPILRWTRVTASENSAVAASYSDTNRRFSAQPGIKMGANVAIETILRFRDCLEPLGSV